MERDETQGFELLPMVEGKEPDIARGQARFAVGMLRQLAKGSPVPAAFPASLAAELELDWQSAKAVLLRNAERNARGDIVGFGGLSLRPDHPHRFRVNGLQFTTWCAWDTLFLPSLLMQDAVVETPDPDSGALIHVQVTPQGLSHVQPGTAVVSFIDGVSEECVDVATTQATFCELVHFFASRSAAESYLDRRAAPGRVLTLEEGFVLGQRLQAPLIEAARSTG